MEVLPIRAELFVPENKRSAFVYKKDGTAIVKERSKEQGRWIVDGYQPDKKKNPIELWIFEDDDEIPIDRRVLENNPLQGRWGYAPTVKNERTAVAPEDMWFFPPTSAKVKIPSEFEDYKHMGIWVKPCFKRDFSQLGSNTTGFLNVSGEKRIVKGEKHSVTGKWNMLGHNDDIVRGKKKPSSDGGDMKGPWIIYVRKPNKVIFPISVIPGNKIVQCKKKIHEKKGIPIEDQRLFFNDGPLKDEKTVVGSGIQNGDTIDLGPITVYVRTTKGKRYTFEVDPDEMVDDMKVMIEKREGTPVAKQKLYHKRSKLMDGKPISHFNVRHKSILDLGGGMIIYVQPLGGKPKLELEVKPSDTLNSVKAKVKNRLKMTVAEQRLFFQEIEMKKDADTLESYKVQHLDTLFLGDDGNTLMDPEDDSGTMLIFVVKNWDLFKFQLNVEPNYTILDVKKMIEATESIPIQEQQLTFKKRNLFEAKTLDESNIRNRSILHLNAEDVTVSAPTPKDKKNRNTPQNDKMLDTSPGEVSSSHEKPFTKQRTKRRRPTVEIRSPDGSFFSVPIDPDNDTIKDVKRKVGTKLGLPQNAVRMKPVNDGSKEPKILKNTHKAVDGEILEVVIPPIEIELPDTSKLPLSMLPSDTILDVKNKIEQKTGIPKAKQRLFHLDGDEPELDNETPIFGPDFKPGNVIELRTDPLPNPMTIRMPDGSCFHLDPDPDDTILDVKDKIEHATGTPKALQRLFYLDKDEPEINDDVHISGTDFKAGRTLKLESDPLVDQMEVRTPDGRSFHLDIDPGDSTGDIQKKVAKLVGVPVKDIRLILDEEKIDEATYRPSNGDILDIAPQVEVTLPDKTKVELTVLPNMTVADAKDTIEERTGAPMTKHRIFFLDSQGEALDDEALLYKTAIQPGTALEVRPAEVNEITLRCQGRNFVFVVDPIEGTLNDLKRMVAAKLGIPVKSLPPLLLNDDELDDHTYRPTKGDILDIDLPRTDVELPDGSQVQLALLPTHTIGEVKAIVEETTGVSRANQRVFFLDAGGSELDDATALSKTNFKCGAALQIRPPIEEKVEIKVSDPNGRFFSFVFDPREPVRAVKQRIREKIGFPVGALKLDNKKWHDDDDDFTFEEGGFDVRNGGILAADPREIEISLPDSTKMRLAILPTMTLGEIKKVIEDKVPGVSAKQVQRIFFLDDDIELDDDTPFEKIQFDYGQSLYVRSILIKVQHWNGDCFNIDAETNWYIADLKERICVLSQIPAEQQRLMFNTKPVKEDMQLQEQGILHNSTLVLEQMCVRVISSSMKEPASFTIDPTDTVKKLKRRALEKSGDQIDDPCLVLGSRELIDEQTLTECMVQHDDIIILEGFTIKVMHWSGDVFSLESVKRSDTVASLKERILKDKQIPMNEQRLSYEGRLLIDKITLEKQHIKHKAVLVLEPLDVDMNIPAAEKRSLKRLRTKKFMSRDGDDIMPVVPDWRRRIFFFDSDADTDAFVQISIIHWTGYTFVLDKMLLNHKVNEIKDRICILKGIKKKSQRLKLNGRLLDGKKSLREQDVRHKSVLVLESPHENTIATPDLDRVRIGLFPTRVVRNVELTVKHWKGSTFTINPTATEYVDDIKERIATAQNIPVEQQRLTFQDRPVLEDMTLAEQGIVGGSVLGLEPMRVVVAMHKKEHLSLIVEMEHKISTIKKLIATETKCSVEDLCIMFGGEVLADTKVLSECGIEHEDVLAVESFKIFVMDWSGERFEVDGIHQSDTTHDLKNRIVDLKSVACSSQILTLNGKVLQDTLRLKDQGVDHRSVLVLELADQSSRSPVRGKMSFRFLNTETAIGGPWPSMGSTITLVIERWNGEAFSIEAEPTEYVDDLKERICALKKIPVEQQRLLFEGRPVQETNLKDQGIVDDSTLVLGPMKVIIQIQNRDDITVEVADDATIGCVKKIVKNNAGIAIEDQYVVIAGEELDDAKKLSDCGIEDNDVLTIESFKVGIVDGNGNSFEIDGIRNRDTVHDLKQRISQLKSTTHESHALIYNGIVLNDLLSLKDQGVKHRSFLFLDPPSDTFQSPTAEKLSLSVPSSSIDGIYDSKDEVDTADLSEDSSSLNSPSPDTLSMTSPSASTKPSTTMKKKKKADHDPPSTKMKKKEEGTTTKKKKASKTQPTSSPEVVKKERKAEIKRLSETQVGGEDADRGAAPAKNKKTKAVVKNKKGIVAPSAATKIGEIANLSSKESIQGSTAKPKKMNKVTKREKPAGSTNTS